MKTKLKILHLEDTPADAELVERELKKGKIQFEKLVVGNKTAFEKALKEFAPDIIIADHTLPSFDSMEAIKIIKRQEKNIPFILVSATVSDEYAVEIMKAGADDYILKDRLHRLPQAVLSAMEKFSLEKERERMIYDQAHLAAIVNTSNDGIISKTLDGIITSWNLSAEKLFGYSATEAIGKNISIIIPPECLQEEAEFMESIKKGESVQHFETERLKKNGTRVDVSLTISPINDNNGKVIGAAKIVHDITDRKKAEQIIYDSEEKYFSLFENSLDAILLTVTDGKILAANPAACTMFGMSEKEICEAGRFGLVDTKDPRLTAALEERQRTGKVKAEVTAIRENGERFPGEFTSVVYKNANGEERTSMIIRDLSERKHAEEEITKLSLVARKTSNAVVITDAKGKIQWVNDAFTRMTGFELNEIIGKRPGSFLQGSETDQEVVSYMRRKISKSQAFQCDIINYSKSGKKYWTNIKCQPEFDSTGKLTGYFSIQSDITKDKEAEKAIYDLTERITLATNSAKIGIWEWDVVNNHLIWDKIMHQIFGVAEDKFGGAYEAWEAIIHPDDIDEENAKVQRALSGGAKFDSDFRILWPDKSFRYIKGDAIVVRDGTGKPLRMIGTNLDVTEKKRLEKALETERDQFFEMFSKAPSAIGMLKGANHVFEMANPLYLQFIGKKNVIGKTVIEVLPEVIEQGFVSILDNVYRTGETYIGTETLVKVDKEENGKLADLYMNFVYQAYRNGKGEIEGIFFFINDITEHILSRKKIEEKTEKLQTAQRIAKLGYWTHNLDNGNIFWSEEVFNIWERDNGAFQPNLESFEQTIHPEDLIKFKEANALAMNGQKELDFEHRIILPNGKIKWVHERGKLTNNKNQKSSYSGTVQDITERKNSHEKLVKSEARIRGLIQSQTNYVIRTDLQGRYTYGNKKFRDDFGWIYGQKEIVGEQSMLSINEYHHPRVQTAVEKCMSNPGQVFQVEIDKPAKGGGIKATLWDFIYLKGTTNEPDEVQCVGIDITDRVKGDMALKESNRRYELVSKATSDAIYDWDLKSNVLLYGEAFYAMFGYSQEEFSPTIEDFLEKIHPEEKHHITESLNKSIEGMESHWTAEYRFKRVDGKYSSVIEKGFILRDENGKAFRMVGAIQDVTEKKKLEELLDEASRFARIGSFEKDCEKDTVYWSPVTKEIHEVDMDYCPTLEKAILFYKEGESRNAMSNAYIKALNENIPYDLEMQILTANGNERWIRKIGHPTFVNGKCVRINGSFQDITNIKNSEQQALKASEEKEIILESIGDAFFMVDNDWKVTYWNQHSEDLLKCAKAEIIDKNLWNVFPDDIHTQFYSCFHKAVREKSIENFEEYYDRVNKWFEVTAYPSNSGLSVYFKDVTERKESELQIIELNKNLKAHTEELVEANKGLEQFSFIVSHNLRAPVANILGLADLIGKEDYTQEVKNNFLEALLDNVKRLDIVISDLNSILQVKVEMDAKKQPVILNDLVNSIKSSIQNLIEKEKVQIKTHFDVPAIHTVQSYLHSIFYNLIANSIKYRQPGISPQLEIRSESKEGTVVLTFEDNGLGIDLVKKREQVFGLYRRFHHHIEGKGMGLFLVKTQVELLGGKISIDSEVNAGTKFTITIKEKTFK
ncbi:PAS domain S-box protein [Gillisia limnaea]|uniref:histidine kinase n=1 Tax=Gillisia limnaea (strain DSM 15749 / LMG 21470 / R-8282) TaxID=865937 RepID=H2BW58_GILLR|nr:PAS domain S-box protein [Gillisia limnaea]EHQ02975.1 multi-sensor signal transduction histidine kinase [Gillisia limnaea DSM 15749]